MAGINENISKKLDAYPNPISRICKETVLCAQTLPESAVKEHLSQAIRKATKGKAPKS